MSRSTSRRCPPERKQRAVRMVAETRGGPQSEWAAMSQVADLLGVGTPRRCASGVARPRSTPAAALVRRRRKPLILSGSVGKTPSFGVRTRS